MKNFKVDFKIHINSANSEIFGVADFFEDKKVFRVAVIQRKLFITMKDFKVVKVINVIINVYLISFFSTFFNVDNN